MKAPQIILVAKQQWRVVLLALIPILLIVCGIMIFYYQRYAEIIDAGLRGEIFVRSSGIYAAPLTLRVGAGLRPDDLVRHLRGLGYLERGATENDKRGQFSVRGNSVELYPSRDAVIDNARAFQALRISFAGGGIQSITELETRQPVEQAEIEPELISSVINEEREKRKIIEYKDLPADLVNGIVAIEDRQFFEHPGINWRGIMRAAVRDYQLGEIREGGSSITQQLVKNFFLKPERTFKRKLAEAYMSVILEKRLSKQEIMAMYCNQIYLGQRGGFSINGFGQAARAYFGKDISTLALHESALLAGIIQSPNYYSPYSHEDRAIERRNIVLDKMVETGKITRAESDLAKNHPLGVTARGEGVDASDAPYFVDYLMRQLESQYGDNSQSMRSLRIYSTVDLDLQRAAYQAISKHMPEVERQVAARRGRTNGLQAAMVAMNSQTGEILAMVGGRDYARSQLNRASEARRQPGSVFKPFVYAAALSTDDPDRQITPAMMFRDEPKEFDYDGKVYSPGNFGDKFEYREMTARDALVQSKNVITVEIAQRLGLGQIVRFAERAGLNKVPAVPSVALGVAEATPLQMASAYTSFANQGKRAAPLAVKRITTKDGSTIFEAKTQSNDVMSPQVAYIMTSIMADVLDYGTGTRVRQMGFRGIAAGKTGSSRDAWFAGYTPSLVCVVWVGFDDNTDIGVTGGAVAAPMWADFMIRALQIHPELGGQFNPPTEGLVTMDIDPATGQIASADLPNVRHEIFLSGTQPSGDALPDTSIPDIPQPTGAEPMAEPMPERPAPRPATTPRPITPTGTTSQINDERTVVLSSPDDLIPLPPEARRTTARQTPVPAATPDNRSFMRRIADAFGFGSASAQPSPTPVTTDTASRRTPPAGGDTRARRVTPGVMPTPIAYTRELEAVPGIGAPSSTITARPEPAETKAAPRKPTPTPTPRVAAATPKPIPTLEVKGAITPPPTPTPTVAPRASTGRGEFWLEVCQVSGQLPIRGVCPTERRKFSLGQEPTTNCTKHRR